MISARRGPAYAAPAMGRMGKATMSRYDGKKVKAVFGGKGFYIALAVCLLAAGIVGYYTLLLPQDDAATATSVSLVFLSALFTGLNLYNKLARFGGAGTLVPITGFANAVASPAIDFRADESDIIGLSQKAFKHLGASMMI